MGIQVIPKIAETIAYAYQGPDNIHKFSPTFLQGRIHQIDFFLKYTIKDKISSTMHCQNITFWGVDSVSDITNTPVALSSLSQKQKGGEYSSMNPVFSLWLVYKKRKTVGL
jgi:hypothetical protein